MPDFDNQTLAALRGRMVRYLMRSREVRFTAEAMVNRRWVLINIIVHTDYTGQGDKGQTNRYRSVAGGTSVENIKKTRYINTALYH